MSLTHPRGTIGPHWREYHLNIRKERDADHAADAG